MAVKEVIDGVKDFAKENKLLLARTTAALGIVWQTGKITYDVVKQDGNFIDVDPVTGEWSAGHKTERLVASTATATPALTVSALSLKYGLPFRDVARSEITNAGKFVVQRLGSSAATETLTAGASEAAATTVVAGETAATTTVVAAETAVAATETAAVTTAAATETVAAVAATETVAATATATTAAVAETAVVAETATAAVVAETAVAGGATVATGGTLATIGTVASAVALPVATLAVTYIAAKEAKEATDIIIDTRHIYAELDHMYAPGKRASQFQKPEPDVSNYRNIIPIACEVSKFMKPENMTGNIERLPDGRIASLHDIDFSDPKNRAEFLRAIDVQIASDQKTMKDNSSWKPRWLRTDDGVVKEQMAKLDITQLQAAKQDLQSYVGEREKFDAEKKKFEATTRPSAPTLRA